MTDYEYESLDWIHERQQKLRYELDMLDDLAKKFLELQKIKHPDPTKKEIEK